MVHATNKMCYAATRAKFDDMPGLIPRSPYPSPRAGKVMHADEGATHLQVVDPYTHPGVWGIVDDGRNACTHSKDWMDNAQVK